MRLERVSPLSSPRLDSSPGSTSISTWGPRHLGPRFRGPRLRGPRLQGPQPRGPQLRGPREPGGRKMGNWILVSSFKLNKLPVSQPSPSRLLLLVQP